MITAMNGTARNATVLPSRRKQRVTIFLPSPLIERLRNAVYWTGSRPLAQIVTDAVEDAVTEMEHANGGVFPARLAPLKPGRPRRTSASKPAAPSLLSATKRT
jgi:predicted DNA-binding protein